MIRIGGMTPLTTIDFPGQLAAVLYLQGCPWRCSYCHNPELLPSRGDQIVAWSAVEEFLQRRRGLLDAVVFSGGEPTAQPALGAAVQQVKAMGFRVGMHTGGMYPTRLKQVLPWLDWVGLDIKAPAIHYDRVTGRPGSATPVYCSLQHLLDSGVAYECRTTWEPGLFPLADLHSLAQQLIDLGVSHWSLQQCRSNGVPQALHVLDQDVALWKQGFEAFTLRLQ